MALVAYGYGLDSTIGGSGTSINILDVDLELMPEFDLELEISEIDLELEAEIDLVIEDTEIDLEVD